MGGIFLLILVTAFVCWLGMIIKAKVTHQEVPWKSGERHPGTPMARAYRGVGAELPGSPERQAWAERVTWISLGVSVLLGVTAGWITHTVTGSGSGITFAAGLGGFLVTMLVVLVVVAWRHPGPP